MEKVKAVGRVDLFIAELLKDPKISQKQAAINAGYSPKTAESQASRLLRSVKVQAALEKAREKLAEQTEMDAKAVLRELAGIARVDIADLFDEGGALLPPREIPPEIRRAIASIEVDEIYEGKGKERELVGFTRKIKFWSKPGALSLLGKHHKLWVDVNVNVGKMTLEEAVAESMKASSGGE